MDKALILQTNRKLMASAEAVSLTTIDRQGYPQTRAMLNLRNSKLYPSQARFCEAHGDRHVIFFTTNTSSKKVAQIRENPRVAAYFCQPDRFHGLMLGGEIEIIDDVETKRALWDTSWVQYYPGGAEDPDHTLLRLAPRRVRGWNRGTKFEFDLS